MSKFLFYLGVKQENKNHPSIQKERNWLMLCKQLQIHINKKPYKCCQSGECKEKLSITKPYLPNHHKASLAKISSTMKYNCIWFF